jgi:hypothetical protein
MLGWCARESLIMKRSSLGLEKGSSGGIRARIVSTAWSSCKEVDADERERGRDDALGKKRQPDAVRRRIGMGCFR